MSKFKINIPLEAPSQEVAISKAKLLAKIGENISEDNLAFLASLSQKSGINSTLGNKATRLLIKAKL